MIEFNKFGWMIKKELISLKRHPARLVSIIAFPIIMILLFGYGMGGDMTDLPIVVVSQSHGNLTDLTLSQTLKGLENKEFSSVDVTTAYLKNMEDKREEYGSDMEIKSPIIERLSNFWYYYKWHTSLKRLRFPL